MVRANAFELVTRYTQKYTFYHQVFYWSQQTSGLDSMYRKVASSNTSRLEAHAGLFRLLMKGISYPHVM